MLKGLAVFLLGWGIHGNQTSIAGGYPEIAAEACIRRSGRYIEILIGKLRGKLSQLWQLRLEPVFQKLQTLHKMPIA